MDAFGVFGRDGEVRDEAIPYRHRSNLTHASGYSMAHVRRHENGHRNVAQAFGCSGRVVINPREAYFVVTGGPRLTATQQAAIDYGGWAAAGSAGCEGDFALARRRGCSSAELAEARRLARRYA